MKVQLDKNSHEPLYKQIAEQIRQQVLTGRLLPGYRLPPERRLADSLQVNRTTVLNAYRELKAENIIGSHIGQGTVVLPLRHSDDSAELDGLTPQEPIWNHFFSDTSNRFDNYNLNELLAYANRKDVISFATGIASPEHGPAEILRQIADQLLSEKNQQALLLSPVEGFLTLRKTMRSFMETRGCYCREDEIMILSGSQQGIDLAARVFLNPGDTVIVEEPTFFPALQVFESAGARVMRVPMDENGMQADILEQILQRYRPKLIYTVPTFNNPCGTELSLSRRKKLMELAVKYKVLILEDDAYGELRYDGEALPSLKSLDTAGYVLYLSTFSKVVYPGLRIGWMIAHRKIIQRMAAARQLVDLHTNCLSQAMIEEFIRQGAYDTHMQAIRREYKRKRDRMLQSLQEYAPDGMEWSVPNGGYYIWCRLPEGVSATKLLAKAAGYGVVFVPGTSFDSSEAGDRAIRLNFTFAPEESIHKGIRLLCEAVRDSLAESHENTESITEINPIV